MASETHNRNLWWCIKKGSLESVVRIEWGQIFCLRIRPHPSSISDNLVPFAWVIFITFYLGLRIRPSIVTTFCNLFFNSMYYSMLLLLGFLFPFMLGISSLYYWSLVILYTFVCMVVPSGNKILDNGYTFFLLSAL